MQTSTKRGGLSAALVSLSVALIGVVAPAQNTDPQVGTWQLNFEKSTFSAGAAFQRATVKIEAVRTGTKVIVDAQSGGSVAHWEFTGNYDGRDGPISGNCQYGDMAARTRINATTVQTTYKKGGTVTATQSSVVSADGKTRTVTTRGVNAAGNPVNLVTVYERQ